MYSFGGDAGGEDASDDTLLQSIPKAYLLEAVMLIVLT